MTAAEYTSNPAAAVEIGWVVAGPMDGADLEAVHAARSRMQARLMREFPHFAWHLPSVRRREIHFEARTEPAALLDHAARERDAMRLDFVFVVTQADLRAHFKPFALGVPSHAMNAAVLSTARIDPAENNRSDDDRIAVMSTRLLALAMHLLGHLNGLPHVPNKTNFMYDVRMIEDLDRMTEFSTGQQKVLYEELRKETLQRLEERETGRPEAAAFYLRAARKRLVDIFRGVLHIRPWLFPFRLNKLTTAAVSALLVLVTTAEAWELGMSQSSAFVAILSAATLAATSTFILKRQHLLIQRDARRLSEQRVVSNVATVLAVTTGMLVTFVILFAATLLVAETMFSDELIAAWASSVQGMTSLHHRLLLAGFVASLGLAIGALGASFEEHAYVRHVIYADEET